MSKSVQFASISHELRSALANIAQLSEQLSQLQQYDENMVHQIKQSSEFLLRVVEGVIDEDRSLIIREASLDKIIEEIVSIRSASGPQLDIWIDPSVPIIMALCDIVVSRVIRNIIQNIDSHSGASKAELRATIEAEMLVIVIKDNGCGIASEIRHRLFSPLEEAKTGHGIGLFLCSLLADKAGGHLKCIDPEAEHCTFELRVPFKSDQAPLSRKDIFVDRVLPKPFLNQVRMIAHRFGWELMSRSGYPRFALNEEGQLMLQHKNKSVVLRGKPYFSHARAIIEQEYEMERSSKKERHWLIVEDDPVVMQVTALMMKAKGFRFSKATSSLECKAHLASGVDVILMDVFLSGESGAELAQELRKEGYEGIIIGVSAEPKALDDTQVFDMTILKPLSLATLNALVNQLDVL